VLERLLFAEKKENIEGKAASEEVAKQKETLPTRETGVKIP